jgi:methylisocitrate lyase
MAQYSAGAAFRKAVQEESPLQVVGAINANHALLAKRAGFKAIYLSGGGVAAGSLGLPDLGISNLDDVLTDVRRITDVCDLPLLVDVDTGFGSSAFNVARTVKSMIKFGAAAPSVAAIVPARRSCPRARWSTVSRLPWTPAPTKTSSSWRAPMRWRWKDWTRPSSAPWPAWKPAPT